MGPELAWVKDAADIIGSAGLPGFCALLIVVIKKQREELREERERWRKREEERVAELTSNLTQIINVTATSKASMDRMVDVTEEHSRLVQSALDLLRVIPDKFDLLGRLLDQRGRAA